MKKKKKIKIWETISFFRIFLILTFPIWDSVRPELTWTHYRTLMRVEDRHIRSFYMTYMPTEEELTRVINEEKRLIEDYKLTNK